MKSANLIYKSALIVFLGIMFSRILGYFSRVIIAREGLEIYGIYNLALFMVQFVIPLILLGLGTGLMRYLGHYDGKKQIKKKDIAITSSISVVLVLSIVFFFFFFFFSQNIEYLFDKPGLAGFLRYFAFAIPFLSLISLLSSVLKSHNRIVSLVLVTSIIQSILELVCLYFLFSLGYQSTALIISVLLPNILSLMLLVYYSKKDFSFNFTYFDKSLFYYSLPLMPIALVASYLSLIDTIILGYLSSATDVAIYNAGLPTSQIVLIFSTALLTIFLPLISKKNSKGKNIIEEYVFVFRGILFATAPFLIFSILFSEQILISLFGEPYVSAASSFIILTIAYSLYGLSLPAHNVLILRKKQKILLYLTLGVLFINILLNFLLIPYSIEQFGNGAYGAALSKLVSFFILSLSIIYSVKKLERFTIIDKDAYNIIISSLISMFGVYLMTKIVGVYSTKMLLVYLIIYSMIYILLLYNMGFFKKQDYLPLRELMNFKKINY
ncbi:MAG: oligosaccharide flippase family protein [Nanoarchaeota archaeon]